MATVHPKNSITEECKQVKHLRSILTKLTYQDFTGILVNAMRFNNSPVRTDTEGVSPSHGKKFFQYRNLKDAF